MSILFYFILPIGEEEGHHILPFIAKLLLGWVGQIFRKICEGIVGAIPSNTTGAILYAEHITVSSRNEAQTNTVTE
jgi:hypothetical protein